MKSKILCKRFFRWLSNFRVRKSRTLLEYALSNTSVTYSNSTNNSKRLPRMMTVFKRILNLKLPLISTFTRATKTGRALIGCLNCKEVRGSDQRGDSNFWCPQILWLSRVASSLCAKLTQIRWRCTSTTSMWRTSGACLTKLASFVVYFRTLCPLRCLVKQIEAFAALYLSRRETISRGLLHLRVSILSAKYCKSSTGQIEKPKLFSYPVFSRSSGQNSRSILGAVYTF